MKTALREIYQRMQFHPGPLAVFFNPFFLARRGLLHHLRILAPRLGGRVLDVGCGRKPYRKLFNSTEYVGLEIDTPANRDKAVADFFYDGKSFPFPDASFDGVFASQVLEHVFNPDEFLIEVRRILKPGGRLLLTVPFCWDEHEQPWDYARYSSFGLRHLAEKSGFKVEIQEKSLADLRLLFQMLNAYIFKKTGSHKNIPRIIATFFLMSPVSLAGWALYRLLPRNDDLYLDNILLALKPDTRR